MGATHCDKCGAIPGSCLVRETDSLEFVCPDKLISFHRDGNLELRTLGSRLQTSEHFSQTADSHWRITARKSDEILDPAADFNIRGRQEANSP
jgi:hypothetical protein